MSKTRRTYHFKLIYILVFLMSIADAMVGYVQSSFLNNFFSLSNIGLIIALCSLISIAVSIGLPKLIAKNSVYKIGISLVIINILCALILAFSHNAGIVLTCFILRYLGFTFLLIVLDIFLEKISADKITGYIRSIYLTVINVAWFMSPWLMGKIVGDNNYGRVYFLGSIIMTLFLIIMVMNRRSLREVKSSATPKNFGSIGAWKQLIHDQDLLATFGAVIALNIFYTIAVLYIPIYLNQTLNFSWPTIGVIFTVMLLPFILLQFPAGLLADRYLGEKEMMIAGNLIVAGTSAIIFLTISQGIIFWAFLLFMSRIGAALTESMQEIYFYKKVSVKNIGLINFFRQAKAVGWLIGAVIAFVALKFTDVKDLFLIVAIIVMLNTLHLSVIKDTK